MDLKRRMRERILESLAADLEPDLLGAFDEERRADTNHHLRKAAYAAAFGVFGPLEDSPLKGREDVWAMALQMFDRISEWQNEDGLWTWYIPATRKSHQLNYVWSVYAWLRTLQDFGDHFGTERREKVERMLRRAMLPRKKGAEQYLSEGVHPASKNIFVHCTLELWLAGGIFGEDGWRSLAAEALEKCLATQFADGYWPDANVHRGPTTRYNMVTLRAASAYARMSGSAAVLQTVQRAADYHLWLSYPDGSAVETVDERNRYTPGRQEALMWCFAPFADTQPAAAFFAGEEGDFSREKVATPLSAVETDAWAATPEGDVPPAGAASGAKCFPSIPAATVRRGPWYACLSAATTQVPSSHFHHDLQNHLSLWHDATGLAVGGGNSLHAPLFSTFRFQGQYLADGGEAEARNDIAALNLRYGGIVAHLELAFEDERTALLRAWADGDLPPDSEFAFHLPGLQGQIVRLPESEAPLTDWAFWMACPEGGSRFRVGPLAVESDRPLRLLWPCEPVNIYDPPARLPLEKAVLRVSARISEGPVSVRLSVETGAKAEG